MAHATNIFGTPISTYSGFQDLCTLENCEQIPGAPIHWGKDFSQFSRSPLTDTLPPWIGRKPIPLNSSLGTASIRLSSSVTRLLLLQLPRHYLIQWTRQNIILSMRETEQNISISLSLSVIDSLKKLLTDYSSSHHLAVTFFPNQKKLFPFLLCWWN